MVINIDKESLLKAITIADSVISSKNINTILSNCLFNVTKDEIEIVSTDNEIAVRTKIKASSDSNQSLTANGKKFHDILKELPDDDLSITVDESLLIDIKTKSKEVKGHYTIFGTSTEEYPEIPEFLDEKSVEIEQVVLREMIRKVIYSASSDTIKPVFNGIFLVSESDSSIYAVATDSRRLSLIKRSIKDSIDLGEGIIIPLKTLNEVYRLLESSGTCRFSINKNQCFFKISQTEVISRIVDGQFPNYNQVVPKEHILQAEVDTRKLLNSVRRAMIFTREPANKIILNFNNDKLQINASTPELGEAEEEIEIASNSDVTISIGINAQFLIDSLREIDSEKITCGITGQMSPVSITPIDDEDYLAIIMPIQIKSPQGE